MVIAHKTVRGKEMTITLSDRDMEKLAIIKKRKSYIGSDEGLIEMLLGDVLRANAYCENAMIVERGEK